LSADEELLMTFRAALSIALLSLSSLTLAADPAKPAPRDTSRGDAMIAAYFKAETDRLTARSLSEIRTKADWEAARDKERTRLLEMLGLDPMPEKTPLKPVITGTVEEEEFLVENVHFQSRPGLYVTGNLYRPKKTDGKKLPAILYVCGHGRVKKDGISYGNKTHYQHHGAWFARNGYVCLTIDTLQLGEIEGIHHGTYSHGRFWWNSRGYSPAGVEAWNCVRALDYLQSRPEVDGNRLGVTGRSGGGAYSWWIAAIDERIKAAVPVAGITSLHNHVVDGTVEGHCDCMFMVNTYGWDFAQVAALVAPRPLLISNTDKDGIFPLDGVVDVHRKTRRIYDLYGAGKNLGLQITEGPHRDTQELRVHAFHWFNRFLKGEDPLIATTAVKFFEPEQLKVFDTLPADEVNTKIDETFVKRAAEPNLDDEKSDFQTGNCQLAGLRKRLAEKCFRGWPSPALKTFHDSVELKQVIDKTHDGIRLRSYTFLSQENIPLTLFVLQSEALQPGDVKLTVLNAIDEEGWSEFLSLVRNGFAGDFKNEVPAEANAEDWEANAKMLKAQPWAMAWLCPRGIGPTAWDQSDRKQTQHRRRFALLGQTLDGMRLWDVLRGAQAVRQLRGTSDSGQSALWLQAQGTMAGLAVYAGIFDWSIGRLDLYDLPASHRDGPEFLNVLRLTDMPQAVAQLAYRTKVVIYGDQPDRWAFAKKAGEKHKSLRGGGLQLRSVPK
jgi:dienelactone hydrolase